MPWWKRELAWAIAMLLQLAVLGGLIILRAAALPFSWSYRSIPMASEDVLFPLLLAILLGHLVTGVAVLYWLGVILFPGLERSPRMCCLVHVLLVAALALVAHFLYAPLGITLLLLGTFVVLAPRLLFLRLRPWAVAEQAAAS
jgi:hypothetical protein